MNKTLTINLSGIVFHIDENAYNVFNAYIDSIRRHFASSEGKDEIMQDIEARIAEMFQLRINESKQVITMRDVEEVTDIMGRPEQFGDEEATAAQEIPVSGVKRRLFRNPDDEIVGGVCSGIGAYFGIDPVWLRLAFVASVILFGTGILLYIILWIVIPEAKTTADKLMMRGEQVTVSNIEKNVKEEFETLKKRAGEFGKQVNQKFSEDYTGFKGFLRRLFDAMGELAGFIFKVLSKLFAVLFIIIGLAVFAVLLFAVVMVPGFWEVKLPAFAFPALLTALFLIGIPALLLFYHGFRELFNIKAKPKIVNITAGGLWLVGLVIGIISTVMTVRDYSEEGSTRQQVELVQPENDTLAVVMINDISDADGYADRDDWKFESHDTVVSVSGSDFVRVDIQKSSSGRFELTKIVQARGSSRKAAAQNAAGVQLAFEQTDNKLILENHYDLSKKTEFAFQEVKYIVGVPEGKTVFLDQSLSGFLDNVQNTGNIYDYDMMPHHWKMTEKGLECTDCTGSERTVGEDTFHHDATVSIGSDDKDSLVINKRGIVIKKDGKDVLRANDEGVLIRKENDKE